MISEDQSFLLKTLWPFLAAIIVISVLTTLGLVKYLPSHIGSSDFVTFDIIKYTNSQRKLAEALIGEKTKNDADTMEALGILNSLAGKTLDVVNNKAKGRTVLVKQSVVGGSFPDITDEVLVELNLPVDVPTSTTERLIGVSPSVSKSIAPTTIEMTEAPLTQEKPKNGQDKIIP